ncbi:hypothetical protein V760_02606 [Staphylococcus aureus F23613]|uniref:hypothetical protein n=1 Tax=Staphylococcus aureus TaxID=1280 RepID=UPI00044B1FDF|nr:hypothetical protein [Staphylococcus aureus]EXQ67362.1 hypothetical protein V760_02606 [Staphylococcus aureus F23613]
MFNQKKYETFIKNLKKNIYVYNQSEKNFMVTSEIIRKNFKNKDESLQYMLEFELNLSGNSMNYYYTLKKRVKMPFTIDVSKLTVETLVFDDKDLNDFIETNGVSYGIIKDTKSTLPQPTLSVSKQRANVTGGFETDYITPIVKQNNPDSKISDDELNRIIKASKPMTKFIYENK